MAAAMNSVNRDQSLQALSKKVKELTELWPKNFENITKNVQALDLRLQKVTESIPNAAIDDLSKQLKSLEGKVIEVKDAIPTTIIGELKQHCAQFKREIEEIKKSIIADRESSGQQIKDLQKSIPKDEIGKLSKLLETFENNLNDTNHTISTTSKSLEKQVSDLKESIPFLAIDDLSSQIVKIKRQILDMSLFFEKDSKQNKTFADQRIQLSKDALKDDINLIDSKTKASIKNLEMHASDLKTRFDYCQKISFTGFAIIFALGAILVMAKN